ncbi:hypothetical protein LSAT2_024524 [Lamellibrachia satsuma]|nr:hypothetical protein LSAT2_024524 [Lamellibrachia satsuma]
MATGYLSVLLQPLGALRTVFGVPTAARGRSGALRVQPEIVQTHGRRIYPFVNKRCFKKETNFDKTKRQRYVDFTVMASPWLLASCIFFLCIAVGSTQNETTEDTDTDDESCMCDPCLNHGSCMKLDDGYICLCLDHYHGKYCEKHGDRRHPHNNKIQPCKHSPCKHGGTCIANGTTYNCTCVQGYYGNRCKRAKVCDNSHCGEKKHCVPYLDAFKCDCPRGYHGKDCELTESNSCIAHPCQNGGKCRVSKVGNRGKYTKSKCACPKNYVGYFCERVHQCASKPCLHGGLCQISGVGYRCICRRNYYGINCQAFAPCTSNPCLNNGGCEPREHAFACICAPGFEGSVCQRGERMTDLAALYPVPQSKNKEMKNLAPGEMQKVEKLQPASVKMQHKKGSIKKASATIHLRALNSPCSSQPCVNGGTCSDDAYAQNYVCFCPPMYQGENCQGGTNVDFLKTKNLMTLFDVLLAAQLAATAGNLSANSAKILSMVSPAQKITNKTQCAKDTCFNDGKCTEIASFGYICDCPPAYEGRNCEGRFPRATSSERGYRYNRPAADSKLRDIDLHIYDYQHFLFHERMHGQFSDARLQILDHPDL